MSKPKWILANWVERDVEVDDLPFFLVFVLSFSFKDEFYTSEILWTLKWHFRLVSQKSIFGISGTDSKWKLLKFQIEFPHERFQPSLLQFKAENSTPLHFKQPDQASPVNVFP